MYKGNVHTWFGEKHPKQSFACGEKDQKKTKTKTPLNFFRPRRKNGGAHQARCAASRITPTAHGENELKVRGKRAPAYDFTTNFTPWRISLS